MNLLFNIGIIFLISSFFFENYSVCYEVPNYVKLSNEITEQVAKKLKKKKNLYLVGTGGQMMHDVQMMAMSFYFYQEVDLKTARNLIFYSINEYLININNNKKIKPYLHNYPFTAKNIEIRIWIFKPNGSYPSADKIHYISAISGNLSYYLDLPETHSRCVIFEEIYEKADEIPK